MPGIMPLPGPRAIHPGGVRCAAARTGERDAVLAQAAGLAVLAGLSPAVLLIAAVYLGSSRPRMVGACYLAGAVTMSVIMGIVVLVVLRTSGLSLPHRHQPRYGLRLGLGLLLLAAAALLARRGRKPPGAKRARPGLVSRMVARPSPASAFAVGVLLFAPGLTFIAAVQVIATARASLELTVAAVSIVVALNVMLAWLPLLAHVVAPATTPAVPDRL